MRLFSLSRLLFLLIFLLHALPLNAELLKLTILHINDPHAHYLPYVEKATEGQVGGFARMETLIKDIEAESRYQGRETLLLMSGDLLTGTPFSMAFKGDMGAELLNAMGFDAMAVGNHEFDYGLDNLLRLKGLFKFPLLSANIKDQGGKAIFEPFVEKQFPGLTTKIFILGLTTRETPVTTHPKNINGLTFEDPAASADKILQGVSEKELVIALTHLGFREDEKLAQGVPRINVIIGGHSHTALFSPQEIGKTVIAQAGYYSKYLGRLDIDFEDGRIINYSGRLIVVDDKIKEDPKIATIIEPYKAKLAATFNNVIGSAEIDLEGDRSKLASGADMNLGKIIAYLIAKAGKADASFLNAGSVRGGILTGPITLGDIYTALPFQGTVVTEDLKGSDIEAVLQKGFELSPGSGGRLYTFGVDHKIVDGRVKVSQIGGRPFDADKDFSIATNDFLASGGDGYAIFGRNGKKIYDTGEMVSDLLADFVRENKTITREIVNGLLKEGKPAVKQ